MLIAIESPISLALASGGGPGGAVCSGDDVVGSTGVSCDGDDNFGGGGGQNCQETCTEVCRIEYQEKQITNNTTPAEPGQCYTATYTDDNVDNSSSGKMCGFRLFYSANQEDSTPFSEGYNRISKNELKPPSSLVIEGIFNERTPVRWEKIENEEITGNLTRKNETYELSEYQSTVTENWNNIEDIGLGRFKRLVHTEIKLEVPEITSEQDLNDAVYEYESSKLFALGLVSNFNPNQYKFEEFPCPPIDEEDEEIVTQICTMDKPACNGEIVASRDVFGFDANSNCIDITDQGQCVTSKSGGWEFQGTGYSWICRERNQPIEYEEVEICEDVCTNTCSEPPPQPDSGGGEETPDNPDCDICEAMGTCSEAIKSLRDEIVRWLSRISGQIYQLESTTANELRQNREFLGGIFIRLEQVSRVTEIIKNTLLQIQSTLGSRLNNIEWYIGRIAVKIDSLISGIQGLQTALEGINLEVPVVEDIEYDYTGLLQQIENAINSIQIETPEFPEIQFPEFPEFPEDVEYDYSQPLSLINQGLTIVKNELAAVRGEIDTSLIELGVGIEGDLITVGNQIDGQLIQVGTKLTEVKTEIDTSLAEVLTWLDAIIRAIENISINVTNEGNEILIGERFEINLEKLGEIYTEIGDFRFEIGELIRINFENLINSSNSLLGKLIDLIDLIGGILDLINGDSVEAILNSIYTRLNDVITAINNWGSGNIDLSELINTIINFKSEVKGKIYEVVNAINHIYFFSLPALSEFLNNIYAFSLPQINDLLNEIITAINGVSIEVVTDTVSINLNSIENRLDQIISELENIYGEVEDLRGFLPNLSILENLVSSILNNLNTIQNKTGEIYNLLFLELGHIKTLLNQTIAALNNLNLEVDFSEIEGILMTQKTELEEIKNWAEQIYLKLSEEPIPPPIEDCVTLPAWYIPGNYLPPLLGNQQYCPFEGEIDPPETEPEPTPDCTALPEWYEVGMYLPPLQGNNYYCPYEPSDDGNNDELCEPKPDNWDGITPAPDGKEWCEDIETPCLEKPDDFQEGDQPPTGFEWCQEEGGGSGLAVCPTNLWNDDPFPVYFASQMGTKFPLDIVGQMPQPVEDDELVIEFFGQEENISWFIDALEVLKYPVWLSFIVWVLISL